MSVPWIDTLQQAIADKLTAELLAKLELLEIEYGDDIPLPQPIEIWPCDKVQVNPPSVEVWCPDSVRINPDETAIDYQHRITVVWTITGTDEVVIDKQIKRYLLATIRLLDNVTFGLDEDATPMIAGPVTYLVAEQDTEGAPFVRVGAVEFTAGTHARFSEA